MPQLEETQYRIEDHVATLTLHRPLQMNAFTWTMMDELCRLIERASEDDDVRCVIVTGAGKAFCAGADLSMGGATFDAKERRNLDAEGYRDGGGRVALALAASKKPVIAAIQGHAVGVGITMTLPMDVRVVSDDAKVGFVFARRGITMEACSSYYLPRLVGLAKASEWVLTGRIFRAADEATSGLFNHVVPREEVLTRATAIAREVADNTSPVANALNRALLVRGAGAPDPMTMHRLDSQCIYFCGGAADAREGVTSFLEKRPPRFTMKPSTEMPPFYPL